MRVPQGLSVMMRISNAVLTVLVLSCGFASANVEKTVFVAPAQGLVPDASIDNLLLIPLNPEHTTARTWLDATFSTAEAPQGTDTWMLLEGLVPGSRYELRICWLATQPTAFKLSTHTMGEAFDNPTLLSAITVFSNTRRQALDQASIQHLQSRKFINPSSPEVKIAHSSLLFLQISAAADYYSLNKTLMEHVPPVFVDVILDRYILNVFPKSLVPTASYIVVLAIGSWFLSTFVWRVLAKAVQLDAVPIEMSKKDR